MSVGGGVRFVLRALLGPPKRWNEESRVDLAQKERRKKFTACPIFVARSLRPLENWVVIAFIKQKKKRRKEKENLNRTKKYTLLYK